MRRHKRYARQNYSYKPVSLGLHPAAKKGIAAILLLGVGALGILSFFGLAGQLGRILDGALAALFGSLRLIFSLSVIMLAGLIYLERGINLLTYSGFALLFLSLAGLVHLISQRNSDLYAAAGLGQGGGYAGFFMSFPLLKFTGLPGAILIFIILAMLAVVLLFNASLSTLWKIIKFLIMAVIHIFRGIYLLVLAVKNRGAYPFSKKPVETEMEEEEEKENPPSLSAETAKDKQPPTAALPASAETAETADAAFTPRQPKRRPKIEIPLEILGKKTGKAAAGDIKTNMEIIRRTFANFGIDVEMGAYSVGPTVTQYTLKPAEGVRLSRITALGNDLALALAAHPIRIEAPIPGKSLVGIEVPNRSIAIVNLRDILSSENYRVRNNNLHVAVGEDVAGKSWVADLSKMPHLLVAGSTGSGKSVCLNAIILSLLYANGPDDLKFILVDPKRVEFPVFNGIPHLLTPVVTDTKKTVNSLKWAIGEMERRFDILSKVNKRDIKSYNAAAREKLPYIIIVVDELADLMAASGAEIEACIIRLAQMSRAVGIHLVLATQRPSVDVITGLIKANITSRIAFSVGSIIDSRTILDTAGAEKLLGRGDMLFMTAELSKPKRLQGAYVSEDDAKQVAEFLKKHYDNPAYDEGVTEKQKVQLAGGLTIDSDEDPLIQDAIEVIMSAGKASASLLQRRLSVGYARAARLLDILEEQGAIGPADGAKPREILIKKEELATQPNTEPLAPELVMEEEEEEREENF